MLQLQPPIESIGPLQCGHRIIVSPFRIVDLSPFFLAFFTLTTFALRFVGTRRRAANLD